jgi:hypothetical protein
MEHTGACIFRYVPIFIENICLDFLSELNKNYENKAERSQQQQQQVLTGAVPSPSAVITRGTEPPVQSSGRVSRSASTDSGGFPDTGFKMPENFDIPQDYIQQIVPKRTPGK